MNEKSKAFELNDLGTLFWKYVFQVYLLGKINGKAIS